MWWGTMGRSRSQLSPLLRCAWDSATLRMLDRDRLMQASGGHLSLIGHITQRELAESLHRTEAHNGFPNRCLWACVERSQCLPDGGNVDPQDSAASLFGTCVGDSIADRILEALRSADSGLTRKQIRDLFHGNISSSSIDQALEKLSSLGAATCRFTGAGRGRPATLWSAIGHEYAEPIEEETPEESLSRRLSALVRTF